MRDEFSSQENSSLNKLIFEKKFFIVSKQLKQIVSIRTFAVKKIH